MKQRLCVQESARHRIYGALKLNQNSWAGFEDKPQLWQEDKQREIVSVAHYLCRNVMLVDS